MPDLTNTSRTVEAGDHTVLGATWTGEGTQLRAFLGACGAGRALPVRREAAARKSSGSSCRNTPTRSGTAICPASGRRTLYGYRVHGAYEPENGHRFNPNKLLLDPYARELVGDIDWSTAHFGYDIDAEDKDLSFNDLRQRPGHAQVPRGRSRQPTTGASDRGPRHCLGKHHLLRDPCAGFTKLHPAVPEELRGTFEGIGRQGRRRLHQEPRHHLGRTAADPRLPR